MLFHIVFYVVDVEFCSSLPSRSWPPCPAESDEFGLLSPALLLNVDGIKVYENVNTDVVAS